MLFVFFLIFTYPKISSPTEEGPIKLILCAFNFSTKLAFSDKKPYPGCTASAPETSHAAIIDGILRYDSLD